MIKVVFCLCRQPSLTGEEFQDHWLNLHVPLVKNISRYCALRAMSSSTPIMGP